MDINNIIIDQKYIDEIMSIIGYPIITLESIEYSSDNLEKLVLIPAIRQYYKWFPKTAKTSIFVSGSFEVDFPTSDTFDVVDIRFNSSSFQSDQRPVGNALIDSRNYYRSNYRRYGTKPDYNLRDGVIAETTTNQSMISFWQTVKHNVNYNDHKVEGYVNTPGHINITWAKFSENFADIPLRRLDEVLELCQAYLLEKLTMIRGQMISGLPTDFNYTLFEDKATEMRGRVLDNWKSQTKVSILRV
jgi:hypothetical protein